MSSISDILTATKNIVTAINGLGQTYIQIAGSKVSAQISTPTVVLVGQGRLARIVITTSGTTSGSIYDASVSTATSPKIYTIDHTGGGGGGGGGGSSGIRVIEINIPVNNGIVVAPGTGQVVTVSYS
jgi:hypothetical protein